MNEISHDGLRYSGQPGETVTVTVEAQGTVPMVVYTLDGSTKPLPTGQSIQFVLKSGSTFLQLTMDSVPEGGTYRVVVTSVTNHENNECVHTWTHKGSLMVKDFSFFA